MENQPRRENLVFHDLSESDHETSDDDDSQVYQFISEKLELEGLTISEERSHRLNTPNSARLVIVKLLHCKDRDKALQAYCEKVKQR